MFEPLYFWITRGPVSDLRVCRGPHTSCFCFSARVLCKFQAWDPVYTTYFLDLLFTSEQSVVSPTISTLGFVTRPWGISLNLIIAHKPLPPLPLPVVILSFSCMSCSHLRLFSLLFLFFPRCLAPLTPQIISQ